MSALRVLIVNRNCPPSIGGIQAFVDTFARHLVREGVEVMVAATRMPRTTVANGLPYPVAYGPRWGEMWRLLRWATVVRFSVFDYRWWIAATLLRKRIIFMYHSPSRICPKGLAWNGRELCSFATHWRQCLSCLHRDRSWFAACGQWLSLPVKSRLIDRADRVVNISRYGERAFGVRRGVTILHGIDLERFTPAQAPRAEYWLFLGRLVPEKGCDVLITAHGECVRRGVRAPLAVVGDGPQRAALESLVRSLGTADLVTFHGPARGPEVVSWMQHALATIVPSQWPEAWGRVAVEAMACGSPVIASASGGLQETAGEAGLTFAPGDPQALAQQMLRVAGDPALRATLRASGLALARQLPVERSMDAHLALSRDVAAGRPR